MNRYAQSVIMKWREKGKNNSYYIAIFIWLLVITFELENVYNEFMQKYIYLLHMYLDYYCNENCMMLDFISTYDCIVDGKYSININKNLYDVYRDFEFAKSKRNVFVKIYRKIREII